ncbi:hypothetical protein B0H13DRAFT_2374596 [Mycena leptocephala]|nr:hypothetical protein B0H13DRAFT_2374596 [Mycena leptocephala]
MNWAVTLDAEAEPEVDPEAEDEGLSSSLETRQRITQRHWEELLGVLILLLLSAVLEPLVAARLALEDLGEEDKRQHRLSSPNQDTKHAHTALIPLASNRHGWD